MNHSDSPLAIEMHAVDKSFREVAILDEGRIVQQSDTESLRRQVKQFILPRAAFETLRPELQLLDLRDDGQRVAVTVANAPQVEPLLAREGIEHRLVDLNLDEIFEAYVVGKKTNTGNSACRPEAELAAEET